jgi:hypothetical protein
MLVMNKWLSNTIAEEFEIVLRCRSDEDLPEPLLEPC